MAPKSSQKSTVTTARRKTWLMRAVGLFGILLIGSTWRLWTPQDVFPQVPLILAADIVPRWLEWPLLALMIGSLALLLAGPDSTWKPSSVGFVIATAIMIAVDQHRLQPWANQLIILCIASQASSPGTTISLARLLFISIYFFSAVSKLDHQFLHTLGPQFLETLFGLWVDNWSQTARATVAAIFPCGELCVAVGLLVPPTRRMAACTGVVLHCVLLWILGPFGLNHHLGVLVWNIFFIAQLAILFLSGSHDDAVSCSYRSLWTLVCTNRQSAYFTLASGGSRGTSGEGKSRSNRVQNTNLPTGDRRLHDARDATTYPESFGDKLAALVVLVCIVAPLAEPFRLIDHWPAWQLYAPRNSRVTMRIFESAVEKLPAHLRQHVKPSGDNGPLVRVDLDSWSLVSLSAPIYPQDRFQLGVAAAVARDYGLGGAVVVHRQSVAHRLTGMREETILRGSERLEEELSRFRINAVPRDKP